MCFPPTFHMLKYFVFLVDGRALQVYFDTLLQAATTAFIMILPIHSTPTPPWFAPSPTFHHLSIHPSIYLLSWFLPRFMCSSNNESNEKYYDLIALFAALLYYNAAFTSGLPPANLPDQLGDTTWNLASPQLLWCVRFSWYGEIYLCILHKYVNTGSHITVTVTVYLTTQPPPDIFTVQAMDLSRCHNGIMASSMVLPRHPSSPPTEGLTKGLKKDGSGSMKTSFFSISNLVNGLRQQQHQHFQDKGNLTYRLIFSLTV